MNPQSGSGLPFSKQCACGKLFKNQRGAAAGMLNLTHAPPTLLAQRLLAVKVLAAGQQSLGVVKTPRLAQVDAQNMPLQAFDVANPSNVHPLSLHVASAGVVVHRHPRRPVYP